MSRLFVVGISWRTAPVAIRERLAFREDEIEGALDTLRGGAEVAEAMLISTCNRVEVYGVARDEPHAAIGEVRDRLVQSRGLDDREVSDALYHHAGDQAVRHVFRVASALDSLVLGEAQILGQLKGAYGVATHKGASGPLLGRCLERAFGVAKRVRTETTIARGAANVSSVAVELAARVFGDLTGRTVLVVGAGKMSTLAARHLRRAGVEEILVTNRSPERAERLADEIDGVARPWDRLEELLATADVVISSTGAREPILTRPLLKRVAKARRWRSMMIVDIAVPRDAEPAVGDLDGVYLFDIDDLEKVVAQNLADRARAAEDASRIVEVEATHFEQWMHGQRVVPTIRAMREHFTAIAEAEAQKTIDALHHKPMTPEQRDDAVRRLAQLVVNKLLHRPQTVLRESGAGDADRLVESAVRLFDLDPSAFQPEAVKVDRIDKANAEALAATAEAGDATTAPVATAPPAPIVAEAGKRGS